MAHVFAAGITVIGWKRELLGVFLLIVRISFPKRQYSEDVRLKTNPMIRSALEEIEAAFADGPPPAEEEIVSRSRFPYDPERNQIREFLSGKKWRELSIEVLDSYVGDPSAILSFLTPQGFSYYLPAFLSVSLTDNEQADVIDYSTLWRFTLFDDPGFVELQAGWVGSLSIPQLEAVESTARALEVVYGPNHVYADAILNIQRIKRERGA